MIDIKQNTTEQAILVSVRTKNISRETAEEYLAELQELAKTAGAETALTIMQDRMGIDRAYYIGKGKAEEIAQYVEDNEINLIIFDDDLSPMQVRNLETLINRKIVDRSGLILDIFASRAQTKEAKTQVELAQLEYMLPRLTRAWTHLSKQYGGIGTKGPGETQIETDRRIIRDRIAMLKKKLLKIEEQRHTQTQSRRDLIRASLVGYTNAGKSTLFNLLTDAGILAEDKLFATLDSTTRALQLDKQTKLLLSDTVGFIRKLPPDLVASFKSTLNEVKDAHIILHIVDVSHPYFEDHISVVEETLKQLGCDQKPQLKILNKIDLPEAQERIEFLQHKYPDALLISALRGLRVEALQEKLKDFIQSEYRIESVMLPHHESKIISEIHRLATVTDIDYGDTIVSITYTTNRKNSERIKGLLHGKYEIVT